MFFEKEQEITLTRGQIGKGVNTTNDTLAVPVQISGNALINSNLAIGKCKGKLGLTRTPGSLLEGKQSY